MKQVYRTSHACGVSVKVSQFVDFYMVEKRCMQGDLIPETYPIQTQRDRLVEYADFEFIRLCKLDSAFDMTFYTSKIR